MRSTFMFRDDYQHTRAPFDAVDQDSFCKIWTRRRRRRAEPEMLVGGHVRCDCERDMGR